MFKCGFYEKDITPPLGGNIPGYGIRRPADGVITPLYTKAVAIETDGKCIIMIMVDSICLPQCVHDRAVEIIEERTGVPSSCVMIHATHAHTGGPVGARSEIYPNPHFTPDVEYIDMLGRMVGDCGVLAYQRLEPMTAKYAKGELYGVSFIRNFIMKDGSVRTNPGFQNPDIVDTVGEIDPDLPVFFFFDEAGKPKGAVVNFTLHHDCVTGSKYCSDYSGVLAEDMKKEFGNDFVTVFINGTCGNINHFDVSMSSEEFFAKPPYIGIGHKMAKAVLDLYKKAEPFEIDVVDGKKEMVEVNRREITEEQIAEFKYVMETIPIEGLQFSISAPDAPEYKRFIAERMLNYAETPEILPVNIQALRFGKCVLFAVPGEVYDDFGKMMKEASPSDINMVAELANGGMYCYVPSEAIFKTTSYEAHISSAPYEADTGEKMARFAVELAKQII